MYSDDTEIPRVKEPWYKRTGAGWFWILLLPVVAIVWGYQNYHGQAQAPQCSNPTIKGNINYTTGEKIYHLPGDPYYNRTVIDTDQGERWFCTVQEAQTAGWRPSGE